MFDDLVHWFRYSDWFEKLIVLAIMFFVLLLLVAIVDPGDRYSDRKTFCLDRGYNKYEISQKNFYCKNTATGDIKKFLDPIKKGVKGEKESWE